YVIAVTASPDNAAVRGGGGNVTGSGEIVLARAPTSPITLNASARNHARGSATVAPTAFSEQDGRMVANVTISLEERARPAAGTGRPAGGGATRPAGGGASEGGTTGGTEGTTGGTSGTTGG